MLAVPRLHSTSSSAYFCGMVSGGFRALSPLFRSVLQPISAAMTSVPAIWSHGSSTRDRWRFLVARLLASES